MSPSPLTKKLLLKPGQRGALMAAPPGYRDLLDPLPEGVDLSDGGGDDLDWAMLFATSAADVEAKLVAVVAAVRPDGLIWICYPKGGPKAGTDLNRDILWELVGRMGLTGVTLVSIDDRWSAMRFRPPERVGS
ncbi:MAG: hypothetical protein QOE92_335 [Chloroflexota bacterium]|jgi:hypothetical protein|nr:hypothetical protein [Chloroflexota bacterium]